MNALVSITYPALSRGNYPMKTSDESMALQWWKQISIIALAVNVAAPVHVSAAKTCYVDPNSASPVPPFTNWATAALTIQDAVDAAATGDLVLVTNGIYQTGGRLVAGTSTTNRVGINKAITVQSVNGPAAAIIRGWQVPSTVLGSNAVRCVYLGNGAVLSGFALTNGATTSFDLGGAVYCSGTASMTNCWLLGNAAYYGGAVSSGTIKSSVLSSNSSRYGGAAYSTTLVQSILMGNQASAGGAAYSCTLTNCVLGGNQGTSGGAANGCKLINCILTNNTATQGGGAYLGSLLGCALSANFADQGGGAYQAGLTNCTIAGNLASSAAGGAAGSTLFNCVIYYNTASQDPNWDPASFLAYSCSSDTFVLGAGNIVAEPQLVSPYRLAASSPCRGAGSFPALPRVDLDGEPWATPPSMGCDEPWPASMTNPPSPTIQMQYSTVAVGFEAGFTAGINGLCSATAWDFADGAVLTNRAYASHAWTAPGDYNVVLRAYNDSFVAGIATTALVHVIEVPIHYVSQASTNQVAPYLSWNTATTNIQMAVEAATIPGAMVLVSNGVYAAGGLVMVGTLTNRVAITKPLCIQSLNGPALTIIQGSSPPGATNYSSAVRCVYLTNGAVLSGFTLTNGCTQNLISSPQVCGGGAAWCMPGSARITNCWLTGNSAINGGAACGGTLVNCILTGNTATTGGAAYSTVLSNCILSGNVASGSGGGAYRGVLYDCSLSANLAQGSGTGGGGSSGSTLVHCVLSNNAAQYGGGINSGICSNCTFVGNMATNYGGNAYGGSLYGCALMAGNAAYGGGAANCSLTNTVVCSNQSTYQGGGTYQSRLWGCTIAANFSSSGGGSYQDSATNCTVSSNRATSGGGAAGSTLMFCTLSNNFAVTGAGANTGNLYDCVLTGNFASGQGGGAYNATLNGCALNLNSAGYGAGAMNASLTNCTVVANQAAYEGGGVRTSRAYNCILYQNRAPSFADLDAPQDCCAPPPPNSGPCNFTGEPQLAGLHHLTANSPCRGAGNPLNLSGKDIDGDPWLSPPSIGCDEYLAGSATGSLQVQIGSTYTNVAVGFLTEYTAQITGRATAAVWDFGDGTSVSNRPVVSHSWNAPGVYPVVLRAFNDGNPGGIAATVSVEVISQPVHYVTLSSPSPVPPYLSWSTAARNIQDAIDAATISGALILVADGVYTNGGRAIYGASTNRVAITKPVLVQSLNGPATTVVQGYQLPGTNNGNGALRCAYLTNGAMLAGFTLTYGATRSSGDANTEMCGGGAWCESWRATVSNCWILSNAAGAGGGGVRGGSLVNCRLIGNRCATNGGGAFYAFLNNCLIASNTAYAGGGSYSSTLGNCVVLGNQASYGPAANYGELDNCTVVLNHGNSYTGGTSVSALKNTVLWYNTTPYGTNNYDNSGYGIDYCCSTFSEPIPIGIGNITNEPRFVNLAVGDVRLQTSSPCINSGNNAFVTLSTDADGNSRIAGGTVDIGAYEIQTPTSVVSYAWLENYGLAWDGTADFADTDGDGMNNWQEWRAGTDPTDPNSVLRMLDASPGPSGVSVTWQSVNGVNYFLQRSTSMPAFSTITSNIVGQTGITSYVDSSPSTAGPAFYRVGVQ